MEPKYTQILPPPPGSPVVATRRATEEGQTSHEDQLNRRRTDVPEIYLNGIWSELATPSSKRSASLSDTNEMKRNVYMDVCFLVGLLCGFSVYYFDLFNFKKDNLVRHTKENSIKV